jgi:uncharacterized protein (DUF1501 family)
MTKTKRRKIRRHRWLIGALIGIAAAIPATWAVVSVFDLDQSHGRDAGWFICLAAIGFLVGLFVGFSYDDPDIASCYGAM